MENFCKSSIYYVKPPGPTRRASLLARAGFHPHFTWESIRGQEGQTSVTTSFCYGLTGPPAMASPLCCVYMDDVQPFLPSIHINAKSCQKRDDQSGRVSPKRTGSAPYKAHHYL